MRKQRFLNAVGMTVLTALAGVGASYAQDSVEDNVEDEVIAVGIRKSLEDSLNVKRGAQGITDAISAEDIASFPDTNLAESLQRITGVSIDRSNNEGNQVTVRGFGPSFNLVTFNGRQMPNSTSVLSQGINRSFNFREISSDIVRTVEVSKTGSAEKFSGGIGATVDVQTAKPFDFNDFTVVGTVSGVHETSVERGDDITPELSGMVSGRFLDGRAGVLLSYSHSERNSRHEQASVFGGWANGSRDVDVSAINTANNPTQRVFAPFTTDIAVTDTERERQNGQVIVQFEPVDGLVLTGDYFLSRFEQDGRLNRSSYWFDSPTGVADENGTLVRPVQTNDELNFWGERLYEETEGDSFGFNAEWELNDQFTVDLDFHDSTSKSNPDDITGETITAFFTRDKLVDFSSDFSGDLPVINFDDSRLPGGAFDQSNLIPDLYQARGFSIDNNIQQIQANLLWENTNEGALKSIKVGFANTKYDVDSKQFGTFAFVRDLDAADFDISFVPVNSDFLSGFDGSGNLFPMLPDYDSDNFLRVVDQAGALQFSAPTLNGIKEDTLAAYIAADVETEFNGMPIYLNAGVRWEDTEVASTSVQSPLLGLQFFNDLELREARDTSVQVEETLEGSYTQILPNFDLRLDPTDSVVTRFSYSRTIARPDIASLFPTTRVTTARPLGPFLASQGNPNLRPLTSDNFDVSAEWYYDDQSYVSVGGFLKYADDFFASTTERRTLLDANGNPLTNAGLDNTNPACPTSVVPTPACFGGPDDPVITFDVATTGNGPSATIKGLEFNVQHMFGDSGFGAIANYTYVDANIEFDPFNFDTQIALQGLSDTLNLVGFYENDDFQVRAAYNWRDNFLNSGGANPVNTEAYGQFDVSASYRVNDNIELFADGINVTNSTSRTYARFEEQLLSASQFGSRYVMGVRARY